MPPEDEAMNYEVVGKNRSESTDGDAGSRLQELQSQARELLEELRAHGGDERDGGARGKGFGIARLQKLVRAELSFLTRLSSRLLPSPNVASCPALRSSNLGHLANVVRILQHPLVDGVSAVMQHFGPATHVDIACLIGGKAVWVILSSRNPKYIRWSSERQSPGHTGLKERLKALLRTADAEDVRKPDTIFLCFAGRVPEEVDRGLRDEFGANHEPSSYAGHEQKSNYNTGAACRHSRSKSVLLSDDSDSSLQEREFSTVEDSLKERELSEVEDSLQELELSEFEDLLECEVYEVQEGEWLKVDVTVKKDGSSRWNQAWESYEIPIRKPDRPDTEGFAPDLNNGVQERNSRCTVGNDTSSPSSSMSRIAIGQEPSLAQSAELAAPDPSHEQLAPDHGLKLVNLDTTALVALVSELSNGGAEYLKALLQADLKKQFPCMSAFIREQALSELEEPLRPEMQGALSSRQPIVSQSVYDEFFVIYNHFGGPKEKERAKEILERCWIVPDNPSARVMALPLTGAIKSRHKIVFGTGDFLNAPTLTANMAFVRAARHKGLPISILEHRPRALVSD